MLSEAKTLVLATANPHKLRELSGLLAELRIPLWSLADFPHAAAMPEDGMTLGENARRKASGCARRLKAWVLADDTGLEVDALGGAPGVRSARYAGDGATMAENRAKLLAQLENVLDAERTARFVCHLALADPLGGIAAEATGWCRGRLRRRPAGQLGFGYDSLFEIVEYRKTLAELGPVATAVIGHRGRAVRWLLEENGRIFMGPSAVSKAPPSARF